MSQGYTAADVFAGGGGFSRGFEEAGFRVRVAIDNYPPAARTYKANFPHTAFIADDVKEVGLEEISSVSGLSPGEVDVVIASPPCEPFTGANPRRMERPLDRLYRDPAGQLFLHAIRLIGLLKPRFFVIENVPGIAHPEIERAVRMELSKAGYRRVYFNLLRAEEHGTPSRRLRVFVSNARLRPPRRRGPSVGEVLKDLPEPGAAWPPNHEAPPELPARKMRRAARLRAGEGLIQFQGAGGRRIPNYIRLDPDAPAPTVMGSRRFIHPWQDRLLTVREQARLMGFPDYHIFLGSRDAQYNMVGEAVPPPLAKAIAEYLAALLEDERGV
ncbi:cytosine-specific DNA methylase [Aeropyrum pernix K1]|uniref:DNA (cytosine-5-)-methyltransferase n=1 Tax=Aeropyrum pernix (strain ATCC 700893 / DSM 11879 / JCM 9820 / NBRC 100138 / K1) TaxID=272557 RepID=Q9YAD7_AERPE|nr:DNA cytosine methyltransferase [Aeropyrum pernix]BAA81012.1 cytosine-specific DNA methylase [Aeropyrum pernix K1]